MVPGLDREPYVCVDLLGVEPVGLAVHAPSQPVGPVHLDDLLAVAGEFACQRSPNEPVLSPRSR
jgi:hypothetical protein